MDTEVLVSRIVQEAQNGKINMDELDSEEMYCVMKYAYTGGAFVPQFMRSKAMS